MPDAAPAVSPPQVRAVAGGLPARPGAASAAARAAGAAGGGVPARGEVPPGPQVRRLLPEAGRCGRRRSPRREGEGQAPSFLKGSF